MANKEIHERFCVLFDLVKKFQDELGTFPELGDSADPVLVPALSAAIKELPATPAFELSHAVEKLHIQLERFNRDLSIGVMAKYPLDK